MVPENIEGLVTSCSGSAYEPTGGPDILFTHDSDSPLATCDTSHNVLDYIHRLWGHHGCSGAGEYI